MEELVNELEVLLNEKNWDLSFVLL
jgi:hypothetical protein